MTKFGFAVAVILLAVSTAFGADPGLLALIPSDAKVIGGINVDRTAASPFGQFLLSKVNEDDGGFQKFVTATGFDPRRDLREIVFAGTTVPGQKGNGLVAARGSFNAAQIFAAAKAQGATTTSYKGVELLQHKADRGGFAILDGSIALAGDDAGLKRAIDQRGGVGQLWTPNLGKINELSANFDAWLVSSAPLVLSGLGAPNPQAGAMLKNNAIQSIEQTSLGVRFGNMVQFSGEAVTRTEKDATALADVLRFLVGMMQLQRDRNPEVAKFAALLDSLEVKATGATVSLSLSIPESDLETAMKPKAKVRRRAAGPRSRGVTRQTAP